MGIYIKGVEMPKHDDEYVIFTVYGDGGVVYGPLNRPHVRYKHRAVTVPEPHGRLIDADAVTDAAMEDILMWEEAGCDRDDYRAFLANYIEDAPTIIQAEEGET